MAVLEIVSSLLSNILSMAGAAEKYREQMDPLENFDYKCSMSAEDFSAQKRHILFVCQVDMHDFKCIGLRSKRTFPK